MKLKYLIIFAAGVAATLIVSYLVVPNVNFSSIFSASAVATIDKNADNLMDNEPAVFEYVKSYGPKATLDRLKEIENQTGGNCHNTAHYAGRFAYELYESESFRLCDMTCQSGCYHGAVEAFFRDKGTANLNENLKTLCVGDLNPFIKHQCVHGVGHGLMAWSDYELFDALGGCDSIPGGESSCYSGVFMENIVQSMAEFLGLKGHITKYLSDDPHYPCNNPKLAQKYKPMCYFLQTDRMLELFNYDFKKVAVSCAEVKDDWNKRLCFESMGRSVGGHNRGNPPGAIDTCANAPAGSGRIGCLIGAVQDTFWEPSGQDIALKFCKLLSDHEEKAACYNTIFGRAPQVLSSEAELKNFCGKAEAEYQNSCLSYIRT